MPNESTKTHRGEASEASPLSEAERTRSYEAPRILSREPLEGVAAVCNPGKGNPTQCPTGPISS